MSKQTKKTSATKKAATKKATRPQKSEMSARSAKAATKPATDKPMSGLDAAAKVLADAGEPMRAKAIGDAAIGGGLWKSDGAKAAGSRREMHVTSVASVAYAHARVDHTNTPAPQLRNLEECCAPSTQKTHVSAQCASIDGAAVAVYWKCAQMNTSARNTKGALPWGALPTTPMILPTCPP